MSCIKLCLSNDTAHFIFAGYNLLVYSCYGGDISFLFTIKKAARRQPFLLTY